MGLFDQFKNAAVSSVKKEVANAAGNAVKSVGKLQNKSESFTFAALPTSVAQLQTLPEASLDSPFKTAALTMAVLCHYEQDVQATMEMLDFLKGPEDVSTYEKQFIRERLEGKSYKVRSFFNGATVANSYTPSLPYTISVSENPYSYPDENWATLYVTSAGADSPRGIKLRKKPSTGQWFLNEIQCLSDIRVPAAEDPWA